MPLTEAGRQARREYKRRWNEKNREHVRKYFREYYSKNRERMREKDCEYWNRKGVAEQQTSKADT